MYTACDAIHIKDPLFVTAVLSIMKNALHSRKARTNSRCEPQHAKLLANTTVRAVERYRDYPEETPVIDQEMKHLTVDPYYDMFSISTGEWATDGSAKHESTGYGMNTKVQGGIEKYHKMPGKQTINRGEALAVLHSLLDTRLIDPLVIYCDSQTTIDSSEKLMQPHISKRAHKDIANYSIFAAITKVRQMKLAVTPTATVRFKKVKSHTDNVDHGSNMNRTADRLAEQGRLEGEVAMNEPMKFCAPATLRVKGVLEENNIYSVAYSNLDAWTLQRAKGLASASPRLQNTNQQEVWEEASIEKGRCSYRKMFVFQLLYRCLPTPRGIQVADPMFPKLYEDSICPLCKECVGNEYHLICKCTALREHRMKAYDNLVKAMRTTLHRDVIEAALEGIQSAIFPEEEVDFKYGDTPVFLRQMALTHMERQTEDEVDEPPMWKIAAIAPKIHKMVTDTYLFVWERYREVLVAGGLTLADRLRDEYNTTALKVSRAHRKAVARRRATALAEQAAADQALELAPD